MSWCVESRERLCGGYRTFLRPHRTGCSLRRSAKLLSSHPPELRSAAGHVCCGGLFSRTFFVQEWRANQRQVAPCVQLDMPEFQKTSLVLLWHCCIPFNSMGWNGIFLRGEFSRRTASCRVPQCWARDNAVPMCSRPGQRPAREGKDEEEEEDDDDEEGSPAD